MLLSKLVAFTVIADKACTIGYGIHEIKHLIEINTNIVTVKKSALESQLSESSKLTMHIGLHRDNPSKTG